MLPTRVPFGLVVETSLGIILGLVSYIDVYGRFRVVPQTGDSMISK